MQFYKALKLITPFSILYIIGFGVTFYNMLFPGVEKWGLLAGYYIGVPSIVLFVFDLIMRLLLKDNKTLNFALQIFLILLFVIWLYY